MGSTQASQAATTVSRREVIRRLAVLGTGLSVGLAAGCTPVKIGLGIHAPRYDTDPLIGDEVLQSADRYRIWGRGYPDTIPIR